MKWDLFRKDSTLIMSLRVPCAFSASRMSEFVIIKAFVFMRSLYALDQKLTEDRSRPCFWLTLLNPSSHYTNWFTGGSPSL